MAALPEQNQCEPQDVWQFLHKIIMTVSWTVLVIQIISFAKVLASIKSGIFSGKRLWETVCRVDRTTWSPCVNKDFCLCYPMSFWILSFLFVFPVSLLHSSHIHVVFLCRHLVLTLPIMIQCSTPLVFDSRAADFSFHPC